ncbi:MAG: DUF5050 domain-containing protein [Polyangiaceae bacterium]|nr:DUF5050 domain-containing protein [Polyangiaceae bacterium]
MADKGARVWAVILACLGVGGCGSSAAGPGKGIATTPDAATPPVTVSASNGVDAAGAPPANDSSGDSSAAPAEQDAAGQTSVPGDAGPLGAAADAAAAAAASDAGTQPGAGPDAAGDLSKLSFYYLDVTGGRVLMSNAAQPNAQVLVASAGQGPDGVAVDVASGYVYWTLMGNPSANDGAVMRSNLDGSNVTTLVPAGGTFTPKQMKLDVAGGKMYWSDREGMRVMRANLDGSNVEALVTTGQTDADRMDESRWCVGVALDLAGGYIYWSQKGPADGGVGSLRRAHLEIPGGQTSVNRTDIEVLYDKLPEPIDIDVDLGAGSIYWTDRADNTLSRAPIEIPAGSTADTRTDRQILVTGIATAIGVALDLARGKVYYTSGAGGALGRANLDGTGNESLIPKAGNLTGIALGQMP